MRAAALTIGFLATLAACSEPVQPSDIPGVYTGTLGSGEAYRLEMGEHTLYRFCLAGDEECSPPEDRGRYHVVRLGSTSIVQFSLLCIMSESDCTNYEANARVRRPGSVEITFVDQTGESHVFVKER